MLRRWVSACGSGGATVGTVLVVVEGDSVELEVAAAATVYLDPDVSEEWAKGSRGRYARYTIDDAERLPSAYGDHERVLCVVESGRTPDGRKPARSPGPALRLAVCDRRGSTSTGAPPSSATAVFTVYGHLGDSKKTAIPATEVLEMHI